MLGYSATHGYLLGKSRNVGEYVDKMQLRQERHRYELSTPR